MAAPALLVRAILELGAVETEPLGPALIQTAGLVLEDLVQDRLLPLWYPVDHDVVLAELVPGNVVVGESGVVRDLVAARHARHPSEENVVQKVVGQLQGG